MVLRRQRIAMCGHNLMSAPFTAVDAGVGCSVTNRRYRIKRRVVDLFNVLGVFVDSHWSHFPSWDDVTALDLSALKRHLGAA